MKTNEQINQLKQISIIDYLSGRGITPVSKNGSNFLYHSPLRQDSTASFSVSPTLNVFNDFGNDADKGSIIDLVMKLEKIGFVQAGEVWETIDGKGRGYGQNRNPSPCRQNPPNRLGKSVKIIEVTNISNPDHIAYLVSRRISFEVAKIYLSQIIYQDKYNRTHEAITWKKDNGGYVAKNRHMKKPMNYIDLGEDYITTLAIPESKTISIFESMFDFLSAIEYYKRPPKCTSIILNSVTNLSKAMPQLTVATTIYSYMDNDEAGRKATQKMRDAGLNVQDCSSRYSERGFKDFNEFLTSTI